MQKEEDQRVHERENKERQKNDYLVIRWTKEDACDQTRL